MPQFSLSEPLPQRFWNKVIRRPDGTGCWDWTGARNRGYGHLHIGSKIRGTRKGLYAHRMMLERKLGRRLSVGEEAMHSCDRPSCVNPAHLSAGLHSENMADMAGKGRSGGEHRAGEANGQAKLTESQVLSILSDSRSQRVVAKAHGLGQSQVWRIRHKLSWNHVG